MKSSRKISVIASLFNAIPVVLGILLIEHFKDITIAGMPVMVYLLVGWAVVIIAMGYVLIPKIEKLEEGGD
jgi:hypothetical protein